MEVARRETRNARRVFVTGGTGYIGRPLIEVLVKRGHDVRALVRPGSEHKLPPGCSALPGNALDGSTFRDYVSDGDTFVQLIGTPHPGPAKAEEFKKVDLVSVRESVRVAQPAPIMQEYIAVRSEGEVLLRASNIPTTAIRPWYVLGPGHRWPYLMIPLYAIWNAIPSTRETAQRLALVTREQMIATLVAAIEVPASGFRMMTAQDIKRGGASLR